MANVASLTSQLQEPAGPFLGTMSDVRLMTSTVVGGQGSLGRILYDEEAYGLLNKSLEDVNAITGNFNAVSGHLSQNLPPIVSRVGTITTQVEQGTRHLPEIGRGAREGLRDANQVLESVKRNFLIRGNLPRDPAPETPTVPARQEF